ncbi:MAG: prepilin-type N-terminal cleavage/methylation domain-containing protein [Candidatus Paceibacterota bacterium]
MQYRKLSTFIHYGATRQSGFTLVEVLVSLALFTVVVVAAIGSLYTVNQASTRVNAMRTVLDNLTFATESMSRTIRTSQHIVCGGVANNSGLSQNCPLGNVNGGGNAISMNSTIDGTAIEYVIGNNIQTGLGEIDKCILVNGQVTSTSCVAITAPEVNINITKTKFYVDGADLSDSKQPSVMMVIEGEANAGAGNTAPFAIQTLISQRAVE